MRAGALSETRALDGCGDRSRLRDGGYLAHKGKKAKNAKNAAKH